MAAGPILDSSHGATAVDVVPPFGMLCVGWHTATERIRAIDALTGRIGWEAPASIVVEPTDRAIAIAGGRVYVAHDHRLTALDPFTGAVIWQVALESEVQTGFGRVCLADPYWGSSPGVLVVQLVDDRCVALDRTNGLVRWWLPDAKGLGPRSVPGGVLLCAVRDERLQLLFIDPLRGPEPVCTIPSPFARVRLHGRNVVLGARDIDSYGNPGIAVVEMPSGRVLLRCQAPFDDHRGPPVIAGPYVWSADLVRFAGSPAGPVASPDVVPGYCIERLDATASTLIGLFDTVTGDSGLRLVGFDPCTLAVRYTTTTDLGQRPELSEDATNVAVVGSMVAVAGRRTDRQGQHSVVLTVLHGDRGEVVWSHMVPGRVENLEPKGNVFVLRTDRRTFVFQPDRPQPVGCFPLEV